MAEDINIATIKDSYYDQLLELGYIEHAEKMLKNELYTPIYTYEEIHPEIVPKKKDIDLIALDTTMDLIAVDNELMNLSTQYTGLISDVLNRVSNIENKLKAEKERIESINMICSSYEYFNNTNPINEDNTTGAYSYDSAHTFSCYMDTENQVTLTALEVTGNGYAGNDFVLINDNEFEKNYVDTSSLDALTDSSNLTSFEYSRLYGLYKYIPQVNLDDVAEQCTITLSSSSYLMNCIRISSDMENLIIKDILTSQDNGRTFLSAFNKSVSMNSSMYDNFNYVNGSNVFCFPETNVIKIVFQSSETYDEKVGYEAITEYDSDEVVKGITTMQDTIRRVISINQIKAYYNSYAEDSTILSGELVSENGALDTIGVFSNEYIPDYFTADDYITYTLILNGVEYSVEPINSDKEGTKYISNRIFGYSNSSIAYIDETIKSAQLRINIKPYNKYATPYVANIKICTQESEV